MPENLDDFRDCLDLNNWDDYLTLWDIFARYSYYIKCESFDHAKQLCLNFDAYFEDQDLFMVCHQFLHFVFFECEEAKSIALLIK